MENVLENQNFTGLSLSYQEFDALYMATLTRIERINSLIKGWESFPSDDSENLITKYSEEKLMLQKLGEKLLSFNKI